MGAATDMAGTAMAGRTNISLRWLWHIVKGHGTLTLGTLSEEACLDFEPVSKLSLGIFVR